MAADSSTLNSKIMSELEIISPSLCDVLTAEAIQRLLGQLSSAHFEFTPSDLQHLISSPESQLFLLLHQGEIIGMLTVGTYSSPTGFKAWIEDVVVDKAYRGRGYGRMLIDHAIAYAATLSPCTLMLTSNPSRIAANELYRNSGFEQKITNVYKMTL